MALALVLLVLPFLAVMEDLEGEETITEPVAPGYPDKGHLGALVVPTYVLEAAVALTLLVLLTAAITEAQAGLAYLFPSLDLLSLMVVVAEAVGIFPVARGALVGLAVAVLGQMRGTRQTMQLLVPQIRAVAVAGLAAWKGLLLVLALLVAAAL